MMAYNRRPSVKFRTLLPAGISVLLASKQSLVFAYYFEIVPVLAAARYIKHLDVVYLVRELIYCPENRYITTLFLILVIFPFFYRILIHFICMSEPTPLSNRGIYLGFRKYVTTFVTF